MNKIIAILLACFSIENSLAQFILYEEVLDPGSSSDTNSLFHPTINASSTIGDFDNDEDLDILLSGRRNNHPFVSLYLNDGEGNFSILEDTPFTNSALEHNSNHKIVATDIDGDEDLDIFMFIFNRQPNKLYVNNGNNSFTLSPDSTFDTLNIVNIAFEDLDNDDDQDAIVLHYTTDSASLIPHVYLNNGSGSFEKNTLIGSTQFSGSITFGDVDGDEDLDVFFTGITPQLYTNDGNGNFSLEQSFLQKVISGDAAFADFDADGDMDLVVSGMTKKEMNQGGYDFFHEANLYANNGTGNFTLYNWTTLIPLRDGNLRVADADGDQDMDLLITGFTENHSPTAYIYSNNGEGHFHISPGHFGSNNPYQTAHFFDMEGDGDADVLVAGGQASIIPTLPVRLYKNISGTNSNITGNNSPIPYRITRRTHSGTFELHSPESILIEDLFIRDIQGKTILQQSVNSNETTFRLNSHTGIYFIEIKSSTRTDYLKLLAD